MRKEYKKIEDVLDKLTPEQIAAVADIYESGKGLQKCDPDAALSYYTLAATKGDPYAQIILANSCNDTDKKLFWYMQSAEQDNPYAQYEIGKRLSNEAGALLWLHNSANQGFPPAMKALSDRLLYEDPKKSKKWLRKYYRSKKSCTVRKWLGKKYVKLLKKQAKPKIKNGEVVIKI